MNKEQAYIEMCKGYLLTNSYYSQGEWVKLNDENEIETEDGISHGGIFDKFWAVNQNEYGWEKVKQVHISA